MVKDGLTGASERFREEVAEALKLHDPRKATRNAAFTGLAAGAAVAAALAQGAGVVELFNPLLTFAIFVFLTVGLPMAWQMSDIDVRLAVWLFEVHRRVHVRRGRQAPGKDPPEYFRLKVETHITPWGTAKMAFEPYSLSLSIGAIAWSTAVGPSSAGGAVATSSAALAMAVALASMGAILAATWIVPPLWLLRTGGMRVMHRGKGEVSRVDEWYNAVLGPVMGVASLGTLFVVYAIAGIGLRQAIFSFVTISVALFPICFAATYLYRIRREGEASVVVAGKLLAMGVPRVGSLAEALGTTPPAT